MKDSLRADALTGQRNEESVLFSLGNFAGIAPAQRPAAPASEGSGLIDIRAMRALIDSDASTNAASRGPGQEAEMMPSFGDGGFNALSVEPLVASRPAPAPSAKPNPRGSSTPLYILMAVLVLGLLGLGTIVLLDDPRGATVTRQVVTAPETVEDNIGSAAEEGQDQQDQRRQDGHAQAAEIPAETELETAPAAAPAQTRATNKRNKTTKTSNTKAPTGDGTKSTSASTAKAASDPAKIDVDCLLNKDLPKCKGSGTKTGSDTKVGSDTKTTAPSPELTNKLDQSQILAGIRPVKTAAKTCGSGTTVAIKFSVAGSTGAVISARALDEHASSAVGKCVAASAKRAAFTKFAAEQQGFTFKFRL